MGDVDAPAVRDDILIVRHSLGSAASVVLLGLGFVTFQIHALYQYYSYGILPRGRGGSVTSIEMVYLLLAASVGFLIFCVVRLFDDKAQIVVGPDGLYLRKAKRTLPWSEVTAIERYHTRPRWFEKVHHLRVRLYEARPGYGPQPISIDWRALDKDIETVIEACARHAPQVIGQGDGDVSPGV